MWIPSLSQHLLITTLIKDQPLDPLFVALSGEQHSRVRRRCSAGSRCGSIGAKQFSVRACRELYVNAAALASGSGFTQRLARALASCGRRSLPETVDRCPTTPLAGTAHPPSYDALTLHADAPELPRACCTSRREHAQTQRQRRSVCCLARRRPPAEHQRLPRLAAGDDVLSGLADRCRACSREPAWHRSEYTLGALRRRRADGACAAVRARARARCSRRRCGSPSPRTRCAIASSATVRSASRSYRIGESIDALLARTERALHVAKQFGRDRVEVASDAAEPRRARQGRRPPRLAASAPACRAVRTKSAFRAARGARSRRFLGRIAASCRSRGVPVASEDGGRVAGGSVQLQWYKCAGARMVPAREVDLGDIDAYGVFVVWRPGDGRPPVGCCTSAAARLRRGDRRVPSRPRHRRLGGAHGSHGQRWILATSTASPRTYISNCVHFGAQVPRSGARTASEPAVDGVTAARPFESPPTVSISFMY